MNEFTPDPDCTDSREVQYLRHEIIRIIGCKTSTVSYFDQILTSLGKQLERALRAQPAKSTFVDKTLADDLTFNPMSQGPIEL